MSDFIYDNFGWILSIIFVAMIAAIFIAANHEEKMRNQFMSSCMADKKEYECTAMWRAGRNSTTIVPVPIVYGR